MKKKISLKLGILVISALSLSAPAFAQVKIGYVDTDRILAEYKPFQDAQGEYKRYQDELEKQYAEKENVIKRLQDEYKRQELLLSDVKKQEMQKDIEAKVGEIQKFASELTAPGGRLQQKNAELSEPIYKDVNVVLERVAKAGGYDFVFNANQIAYAKEEYDITQKVLEELNKDLEAKKKGSPAAKAVGAPGRR